MKNVLIITAQFPPTSGVGGIRSLKFAKYLNNYGWNPIVITPSIGSKKIKDTSLLNELPKDISIHRPFFLNYRKIIRGDIAKLIKPFEESFIFPDRYVLWNRSVLRYLKKKILPKTNIDLAYVSLNPSSTMLIAQNLKKQYKIPFILDFRDPFSFYQYSILKENNKWRKRAYELENVIFSDADHINIVTNTWKNKYEMLHPHIKGKITAIHNGYDEDDFMGLPKKKKNLIFTLGYNGTFSRLEPLKPLLDAITYLHKEKSISMKLSIATSTKISPKKPDFSYLFQHNLIENKGFLSHQKSLENLNQADISILNLNNIPATEGQIPAKIFEYLRINNPVLVINKKSGQLAKIIAQTNKGRCVDIENSQEITDALLDFYEKWKKDEEHPPPNWNEIKKYERKYQTEQLADIFNRIIR